MVRRFSQRLATDRWYRLRVNLVAVAISIPVGLITGNLATASLAGCGWLILTGTLAMHYQERHPKC